MATRVTIDVDALRHELLAATLSDRRDIAEEIVDDFRASAAVRTGAYQADARTETSGTLVEVVLDEEASQYKEYGTSDTPPHAALTNAARRHGRYTGWVPRR